MSVLRDGKLGAMQHNSSHTLKQRCTGLNNISRLQRGCALVLVVVHAAAADRLGRLRDLHREERHCRAPDVRGPQGDVAVGPAAMEDQGRQAEPLREELRGSPHQGEVLGHPPHVQVISILGQELNRFC